MAKLYWEWTFQTACCFKYKTKCKECPNDIVCNKYNSCMKESQMDYKIHPIKYATLQTYKNIGLKGIERYIDL